MILLNLTVGVSVMLACIIVQAGVAFWSVRYYVRQSSSAAVQHKLFGGIRPLLISMLAMMAGNFIQIVIWGVLFLLLGELDELYEAIYHSAVNFASLGYGDFVMSKNRKLLGPLSRIPSFIRPVQKRRRRVVGPAASGRSAASAGPANHHALWAVDRRACSPGGTTNARVA